MSLTTNTPETQSRLPDWSAPLASDTRRGPRSAAIAAIVAKVENDERIDAAEGLLLHDGADLTTLGYLANLVRWRKNPRPIVTYVVDRNINPTNVCITDCGFCAFYRRPKDPESYLLDHEAVYAKIAETAELGGRQVLMQGGHHPYLKSDYWCELFAGMRERFPKINPHALSAPEIDHLTRIEKRSAREVIAELKDAGWGSLPGAGAEMLVERVRKIIAPKKTTTDRWLEIHRLVHEAGLRSSATMMFGNVETAAERVEHLDRLRQLQDETGGFTAFACWNTQPEGVPEQHIYPRKTTPAVWLRVQSLARIYLDNFDHMQTSYVTQGKKMAQVSLLHGCDDFGGTMLEENVVSAAGCFHLESIQSIEAMIEGAGLRPLQRSSWYGIADERWDSQKDGPRGPLTREEGSHWPQPSKVQA